mgnify:CR=1 FL=1
MCCHSPPRRTRRVTARFWTSWRCCPDPSVSSLATPRAQGRSGGDGRLQRTDAASSCLPWPRAAQRRESAHRRRPRTTWRSCRGRASIVARRCTPDGPRQAGPWMALACPSMTPPLPAGSCQCGRTGEGESRQGAHSSARRCRHVSYCVASTTRHGPRSRTARKDRALCRSERASLPSFPFGAPAKAREVRASSFKQERATYFRRRSWSAAQYGIPNIGHVRLASRPASLGISLEARTIGESGP